LVANFTSDDIFYLNWVQEPKPKPRLFLSTAAAAAARDRRKVFYCFFHVLWFFIAKKHDLSKKNSKFLGWNQYFPLYISYMRKVKIVVEQIYYAFTITKMWQGYTRPKRIRFFTSSWLDQDRQLKKKTPMVLVVTLMVFKEITPYKKVLDRFTPQWAPNASKWSWTKSQVMLTVISCQKNFILPQRTRIKCCLHT
jgi:hypothetical protein